MGAAGLCVAPLLLSIYCLIIGSMNKRMFATIVGALVFVFSMMIMLIEIKSYIDETTGKG